jgi:hypothetical protein
VITGQTSERALHNERFSPVADGANAALRLQQRVVIRGRDAIAPFTRLLTPDRSRLRASGVSIQAIPASGKQASLMTWGRVERCQILHVLACIAAPQTALPEYRVLQCGERGALASNQGANSLRESWAVLCVYNSTIQPLRARSRIMRVDSGHGIYDGSRGRSGAGSQSRHSSSARACRRASKRTHSRSIAAHSANRSRRRDSGQTQVRAEAAPEEPGLISAVMCPLVGANRHRV